MEEAAKLCDRIGIIDDGQLIAEGTADGLITAHGGRDKVHLDVRRGEPGRAGCRLLAPWTTCTTCTRSTDTSSSRPTTGRPCLPAVVAVAAKHDVELTGVEVRSPNLEDVFLSLTGKELRD